MSYKEKQIAKWLSGLFRNLWKDVISSSLLLWLHDRLWFNEFNNRQPEDHLERAIWNCRAASVDVFVYKP